MSDLVDYLRDKLEHADDVVCSCPVIDVSTWINRNATARGYSRTCPVHGINGTEPTYQTAADIWRSRP